MLVQTTSYEVLSFAQEASVGPYRAVRTGGLRQRFHPAQQYDHDVDLMRLARILKDGAASQSRQ